MKFFDNLKSKTANLLDKVMTRVAIIIDMWTSITTKKDSWLFLDILLMIHGVFKVIFLGLFMFPFHMMKMRYVVLSLIVCLTRLLNRECQLPQLIILLLTM